MKYLDLAIFSLILVFSICLVILSAFYPHGLTRMEECVLKEPGDKCVLVLQAD